MRNNAFLSIAFFGLVGVAASTPAHATPLAPEMLQVSVETMALTAGLDWKVGDTASYNLSMRFGAGTMVQSVTKDEGTSLWLHQDIKFGGQPQTVDAQINKETGAVEKFLLNGKEEKSPQEEVEVISMSAAQITVPAGTFECTHIVTKSASGNKSEIWANPEATVMDGVIKELAGTTMGDVTVELTSFAHGS